MQDQSTSEDVHRRAEQAVRASNRVHDGYEAYAAECHRRGLTPHDLTHYTLYLAVELGLVGLR
jgi:hypothetical protein